MMVAGGAGSGDAARGGAGRSCTDRAGVGAASRLLQTTFDAVATPLGADATRQVRPAPSWWHRSSLRARRRWVGARCWRRRCCCSASRSPIALGAVGARASRRSGRAGGRLAVPRRGGGRRRGVHRGPLGGDRRGRLRVPRLARNHPAIGGGDDRHAGAGVSGAVRGIDGQRHASTPSPWCSTTVGTTSAVRPRSGR